MTERYRGNPEDIQTPVPGWKEASLALALMAYVLTEERVGQIINKVKEKAGRPSALYHDHGNHIGSALKWFRQG